MTEPLRRRALLGLAARAALLLLAAPGLGGCAHPVSAPAQPKPKPQLTVLVSGAFEPALRRLAPIYERRSGVHLVIVGGPSMGASPTAIPQRLERGEAADVVILAREALDRLAKAGKVAPGSEQDLVLSKIALAVKAGTPVPGIATVPALRATLLSAKSVAYSDSASGVYVSTQLFAKLGIAEAMAGKARMIEATPVGLIVARGEAELGFQQLSELKPIAGIRIVGLLPEEIQKTTRFSAGLVAYSTQPEAGTRLIAFLRSGAARGAMVESGLQPVR